MGKFRKKPVVVEAMKYTRDSRAELLAWIGAAAQGAGVDEDGATYELRRIRISTPGGQVQADIGDWIIKGVAGEFYLCKPDIFAATYEELVEIDEDGNVVRDPPKRGG